MVCDRTKMAAKANPDVLRHILQAIEEDGLIRSKMGGIDKYIKSPDLQYFFTNAPEQIPAIRRKWDNIRRWTPSNYYTFLLKHKIVPGQGTHKEYIEFERNKKGMSGSDDNFSKGGGGGGDDLNKTGSTHKSFGDFNDGSDDGDDSQKSANSDGGSDTDDIRSQLKGTTIGGSPKPKFNKKGTILSPYLPKSIQKSVASHHSEGYARSSGKKKKRPSKSSYSYDEFLETWSPDGSLEQPFVSTINLKHGASYSAIPGLNAFLVKGESFPVFLCISESLPKKITEISSSCCISF